MSEYFDKVEHDLRAAVRGRAHLPWYMRLRPRQHRALVVVIAGLVVAGPALAAAGVFESGSPVPPLVPPTPTAFDGVAIRSTVRLLPIRVPDPRGGPAWGVRMLRTTRGLVCLTVGRVAFGTVGALGVDDAFGNDGRFHAFSDNYNPGPPCATPDAHGNAFINVAYTGVPASGLLGGGREGGCTAPRSLAPRLPARIRLRISRRRTRSDQRTCPLTDLRNVYYGTLGPDAVSITYQTAAGKRITIPTRGTDGAYLIVLPGGISSQNNGSSYDARLFAGPIRAVHYRDGHTCRPRTRGGSCPPVGYAPAGARLPSPAEVASPVTARIEFAKHYCDRAGQVIPCPGRIPHGFQRIDMNGGPAQVPVQISFISRVPITNGHSYYYIQMSRPPHPNPRYPSNLECAGASDFGQTNADYAAGQRVTQSFFENLSCQGTAHGEVTLVITTGPSVPAPMPAVHGQSIGREVGRFSFTIP